MHEDTNVMRLEVMGTFDVRKAWEILEAIAAAGRRSKAAAPIAVELDFTRVRELSDFALASLAHGMAALHDAPAVRTRGLWHHPLRLLALAGLDPETLRPAPRTEHAFI